MAPTFTDEARASTWRGSQLERNYILPIPLARFMPICDLRQKYPREQQ